MAMKPSEHCLYHSQSPLTITSDGHIRSAIETGIGALIPNFFAGMEAAVMMLRLSFGSPETTDGTSLMSGFPCIQSLTALQERNAELTSI